MIITHKTQNTPPPSWITSKKEKRAYFAKGRITVLRLDSLNRVTNDFETKFAPRLAGTTFKPLDGEFCKTPEDAYAAGKALQEAMRSGKARK